MAVFEYKGHKFEADENMSEADWAQTTAYLDTLPAPQQAPVTLQEQSGVQPTPLDYALNPSTLNTVVASKLSGLLGQDEIAKQLEEKATQQATKSANTSWTQAASDLSTAGLDIMAGVVGMPVGIAAGVGSTLLNGPQKGLQTAKEVMGKLTYSNLAGTQEQVSQSPAYNAAMLPFAALTAGMETAGKGYGELTKELGGDEQLAKNVAALTELGLLTGTGAGSLHGIYKGTKGAIQAVKDIKEATKSLQVTNEVLAERALPQIEKRIDTLKQEAQRLNDEGIFDEYVTNRLQEIEVSLLEQEVIKTELKNMRPEKDQALVEKALELRAKIEELKARRKKSRAPTEEHSIEIADERAISKPVEVPRTPDEIVNEAQAAQEVKTTPVQVALEKIGEAKNMTEGELADHLVDTYEKLDNTPKEKTAVREALEQEIKAFEAIQRGEEPNLDWFKGEEPTKKTSPFRTEEQSWQAKEKDINEVNSSISALEKTAKETEHLLEERKFLIEKKNKTLEENLRIAELNDLYTEIAVRNDPVNELRDAIDALKEERADIQWMVEDDPIYVEARTKVIDQQLAKYAEFEQRATDLYNTKVEEVPTEHTAIEAPKPIFNSISDIYAYGEANVLPHLLEVRDQFFNKVPERQVFFDKTFQDSVFGKMAQKVLTHFAEITGLSNDGLYISFDSSMGGKVGNVYHTGDVSHIRLNPLNIEKLSKPIKGTDFGFLKGKALENARTAYTAVRVGAHEIGHVLLDKYIQKYVLDYTNFDKTISDFNTYLKDNTPTNISVVDFWKGTKSAEGYVRMQNHFHEYFAERVANQLLSRHVLGAFSKGRGKTFQALMDASVKYLQERGINVNKQAFIDDTINNIIEFNKITIAKGGETLWENLDRINNDLVLDGKLVPGEFFGKSLEEVLADKRVQDIIPDRNPFLGLDTNDIPSVSRKMLNSLSKAARKVHREFFNRNNIADFDPRDPKVSGAYKKMRDIDIEIEGYTSDMLYDQQSIQGMKWTSTFSKVKNSESMYMTLRKMTDLEAADVLEVFQKGFDEGIPYKDNLTKNGQHLTQNQVKYYNSLAKAYEKDFEYTKNMEDALGKKSIISKREGYFPSSRVGNFAVTINYGSLVAHRQQFHTKLQAEIFRKKLMESPITEFQISDVIDMKQGDKVLGNMEIAQNLADSFARLFPTAEDLLLDKSDKILEAYITRGGKLGHHHEYRFNVSGYKGSELCRTREELGRSFKEANEQFVAEKAMQLKSMKYRHVFGEMLENPTFKEKSPNSYDAIKQMYDNSLNRNVDYVEQLGGELSYHVDKAANEILGWFGKEKKTDKSINEITVQGIRDTFTAFFMTAKPLFVLAQVLSVPPMTIAKMSYTHPLKSYANFATGMFKLLSGNKQMWDTIKEVARTTNTFDAQFMESFALQRSNKPTVEALKDWVLLQAPGRGAESLSRIMAFAAFYEQYRDVNTAIRLTGDTLTLYDKANSPAFFSHMGFVGDAMKPLQSYGQNQLGNIIGMVRNMNPKDVKTFMPMINFAILTVAFSGVQGLPFIQEYESLRGFLQEKFGNYSLPSIFDIAYSKDGILKDNVSQEIADALMLGGGSLTGIDLASSARPNKSLPANLLGMMTGDVAPSDMMPLHKWAASVPGAVVDIGKGIADNAKTSEVRKAFDTVAPGGPLGYGIKEVAGLNETTIFGKNTGQKMIGTRGEADSPRTTLDKVAGMLGGKTTEQRLQELVNFNVTSKEKARQSRIDAAAIKFVETKNPKHIQTLVDLGATEKEILNKLDQEIYNRVVPFNIRMIFNKKGKPIQGRGTRAAVGLSQFKRD